MIPPRRSPAELDAAARSLLTSDRVTAATRRVLADRLDAPVRAPRALSPERFAILAAAAERLVPLGPLQERVDLAGRLDAQLADGPGDGWRYAELAPDLEAMGAGLDALDREVGGDGFAGAAPERRDAAIAAVQAGPPARWFEDLLAALCHLAYAHPLVQLDIGYDGMADARGFQRTDLTGG